MAHMGSLITCMRLAKRFRTLPIPVIHSAREMTGTNRYMEIVCTCALVAM